MYDHYDEDIPDDPYKFFFQIDTEWIAKYIDQIVKKIEIKNIEGFPYQSLPVNSLFSSTVGDKNSLYLGNNYYNEPIWKYKYFIYNKLEKEYVLHLQDHARHVVNQPRYYKGLYEILN